MVVNLKNYLVAELYFKKNMKYMRVSPTPRSGQETERPQRHCQRKQKGPWRSCQKAPEGNLLFRKPKATGIEAYCQR